MNGVSKDSLYSPDRYVMGGDPGNPDFRKTDLKMHILVVLWLPFDLRVDNIRTPSGYLRGLLRLAVPIRLSDKDFTPKPQIKILYQPW